MSENTNKNTQRAAMGRTRLTKSAIDKPDTIVFLPDGRQITLRRDEKDSMPLFRKFNPRKVNPQSNKKPQLDSNGKPVFQPKKQRVPITKVLLGAFLLYNLLGVARGWLQRWQQRRRQQQRQKQRQDGGGADGAEEDEEEDVYDELDDEGRRRLAPEVAAAEAQLQQALLPAMMRAALPKPRRSNAAQKEAQAHRARPRHVPTASKMMHPGPDVKRKQPGMLSKLDQAMRKQVRELVLAQEQAHQLQLDAAKRVLALQGSATTTSAANGKPTQQQQQQQQHQVAAAGAQQQQQQLPPAAQGPVVQAAATPVRKR